VLRAGHRKVTGPFLFDFGIYSQGGFPEKQSEMENADAANELFDSIVL
jgi:hypothetical protein